MDDEQAVIIASENPSIIKRPLLVHKGEIYVGFSDKVYKEIFDVS